MNSKSGKFRVPEKRWELFSYYLNLLQLPCYKFPCCCSPVANFSVANFPVANFPVANFAASRGDKIFDPSESAK